MSCPGREGFGKDPTFRDWSLDLLNFRRNPWGHLARKKTQVKALNHRSIHIHHQHFDNNWQHLNHPTHPNLAFVLEFGWVGNEHVDDSSAKNHGDKNLQDVSHQHVLRAIMQHTRRKINSGSSEVTKIRWHGNTNCKIQKQLDSFFQYQPWRLHSMLSTTSSAHILPREVSLLISNRQTGNFQALQRRKVSIQGMPGHTSNEATPVVVGYQESHQEMIWVNTRWTVTHNIWKDPWIPLKYSKLPPFSIGIVWSVALILVISTSRSPKPFKGTG